MDDHVYTQVLEYAECDLIPRFNEEYRMCGNIKACASYEEISDLCKILNTIAKYTSGIAKVTPKGFIESL